MLVNAIVDLQFGSAGKGLLAGYLAEKYNPDTVVCAFGPNAGHTYIDGKGAKYVHRMLPIGIVSKNLVSVLIGPGAVVDLDVLYDEMRRNEHILGSAKVYVHCHAAVVTSTHADTEKNTLSKIASTCKGTGEAAITKIRRNPDVNSVVKDYKNHEVFSIASIISVQDYADVLDKATLIQVEGAQGYSLSVHHGMYPYVTSRDTSVHQLLADCGLPRLRSEDLTVYGVLRTYPIRVANSSDGTSGPHYADQIETTFTDIGVPVEYTTVTKLPRRIFTYSEQQVEEAIRMNGCDTVLINFVNYCKGSAEVNSLVAEVNNMINHVRSCGVNGILLGYGPTIADVKEYVI